MIDRRVLCEDRDVRRTQKRTTSNESTIENHDLLQLSKNPSRRTPSLLIKNCLSYPVLHAPFTLGQTHT